jgi:hypothetical protein
MGYRVPENDEWPAISPHVAHPMSSAATRAAVAHFRRRWEKWEMARPVVVDWFDVRLRELYDISGWIADEIEARRRKKGGGG